MAARIPPVIPTGRCCKESSENVNVVLKFNNLLGLYFIPACTGINHYLDGLGYFQGWCSRCLCQYSTNAPLKAQPIASIHHSFAVPRLHCCSTSCAKSLYTRGKLPCVHTQKIVVVNLYLRHKVLALLVVGNCRLWGATELTLPLFTRVDHLSSVLYSSRCSSTADFEASVLLT